MLLSTRTQTAPKSGEGAETKHITAIITKEEENLLWDQGAVGVETPESLLRAVFYYNSKNFCLRGGSEQRALKLSQVVCHTDPNRYVFTEKRSGGLWQMCVDNKVVPIIVRPDLGV